MIGDITFKINKAETTNKFAIELLKTDAWEEYINKNVREINKTLKAFTEQEVNEIEKRYNNENSKLIEKARWYSRTKHKGQKDDDGKEYFHHTEAVADLLLKLNVDEDVVCAGYLHDILEDTDTTYEKLIKEFGTRIADLVNEVSHEDYGDKGCVFPRLKTKEGIMIKFADRLHNISRMDSWDKERKEHYLRRSKFWKNDLNDKIIEGQKKIYSFDELYEEVMWK